MKYTPISFKSDYSLLNSLLKISDIIEYAKSNNSSYVGILDNNPYYIMDFYTKCIKEHLKPVCGVVIKIGESKIYLYIKNFEGYQNIIKINNLVNNDKLSYNELVKYNQGIKCVIPYESYKLHNRLKMVFDTYLGYKSDYEKNNALQISKKAVFVNEILYFNKNDSKLLKILYRINDKEYIESDDYILDASEDDINGITDFISDIDLKFNFNNRYIPKFTDSSDESYKMLCSLSIKGLKKRLDNVVDEKYIKRLKYELSVIKSMGFVDYFLIVFDYVKYAKKNNIYVGPGRGSAAGSLVSYSLGITEIDPIKYGLLFERFLNPERVTMPDIDVDFEDIKRQDIIEYVKKKYGNNRVSLIIAYGTLGSRQVVRDVFKIFEIDQSITDTLCKMINPKKNLKDNIKDIKIVNYIKEQDLLKTFKVAMRLEGLKRHTTIHAAGVIISSIPLTEIIPTYINNNDILAGYTAEYLEKLGLLKMDFLALSNLTMLHNIVDAVKEKEINFNLKNIPLDDKNTFELFKKADTDDIFQFESSGMKNFLKKLSPDTFNDLVSANALFRPGPMDNIDEYVERKKGIKQIIYPHKNLEPILKDTYGIIVYQEQIMQILSLMGGYSYGEADIIRRAMSKKKVDVMVKERSHFIEEARKRGYSEEVSNSVYDLIIRFANYGFNKSHSVAYALIGYQIAYLKVHYRELFNLNTLNSNASGSKKIKDIIETARKEGYKIVKPNINDSDITFKYEDKKLILPLTAIKNISSNTSNVIVENKPYSDYFDFFKKTYNKGINQSIVETLIKGGALDIFGYSKNTLLDNIQSAITYLELCSNLDESLIMKPVVVESSKADKKYLEKDIFGFYISEHPAAKVREQGMIRIIDIKKYINKTVRFVGIVDRLKVIDTKKGEKMAFITLSDDSGTIEGVIFPKNNHLLELFNIDDLISVIASVNIRNEETQVIINDIKDIKKDYE